MYHFQYSKYSKNITVAKFQSRFYIYIYNIYSYIFTFFIFLFFFQFITFLKHISFHSRVFSQTLHYVLFLNQNLSQNFKKKIISFQMHSSYNIYIYIFFLFFFSLYQSSSPSNLSRFNDRTTGSYLLRKISPRVQLANS